MVAATDSRHVLPLADHVFRFAPGRVRETDLSRLHGTNERLSVANYLEWSPSTIACFRPPRLSLIDA